jgi:hypothetical protein
MILTCRKTEITKPELTTRIQAKTAGAAHKTKIKSTQGNISKASRKTKIAQWTKKQIRDQAAIRSYPKTDRGIQLPDRE